MNREQIIEAAKQVWSAGDMYIGPSVESLEAFTEPLLKRIEELESDPAIHFAHRFAVVLECMVHSEYPNDYWTEATTLLSEYHEAQDKWREMMGEPYVSGFGKD